MVVVPSAVQCAQRAQKALAQSPHVALRGLRVESQQDRLYISGRVSSFYQKQQAQEAVRAIVDVFQVVNEVEVG